MINDRQFATLGRDLATGMTLAKAAVRSGMSEKTARKYRTMSQPPSQSKPPHDWRTRIDPFQDAWPAIEEQLKECPTLEAKTIFQSLQRQQPGLYQDGQLRTLQRRIKRWRATDGPPKEVYFDQVHHPGDLCSSDFTHMTALGITIDRQPLDHMLYHFVLTCSNWESVSLCYSECFESLSQGFQNAINELGHVPRRHRTDRLSAAVNNLTESRDFTARYQGLMNHYGIAAEKIQPRKANENGDVESSHRWLKQAIEQALLQRGSRDFASTEEYMSFVQQQVNHRNAGRRVRLAQEQEMMAKLTVDRLANHTTITARVNHGSLMRVQGNAYSVHSRLIGEQVNVRIFADHLEVWYAQGRVETLPRLRGRGKHDVNYRHVIDWLVRKPGAFANYRYRDDLFPTSRFRMAFDALNESHTPAVATKEYLAILHLAARESETRVDQALMLWLDSDQALTSEWISKQVAATGSLPVLRDGNVEAVDLLVFDDLLGGSLNNSFSSFNKEGSDDKEVKQGDGVGRGDQFSQDEQGAGQIAGQISGYHGHECESGTGQSVEGTSVAVVP